LGKNFEYINQIMPFKLELRISDIMLIKYDVVNPRHICT